LLNFFESLAGKRSGVHTPVDWVTRVRIALGAARGLAYLHEEKGGSARKFIHGNIKSSNVLLNRDMEACVSDFGLAQLLSPVAATARIGGYRAPEVTDSRKATQKSDVYSFGVVCFLFVKDVFFEHFLLFHIWGVLIV
jgi:serine/threonine protein kinase